MLNNLIRIEEIDPAAQPTCKYKNSFTFGIALVYTLSSGRGSMFQIPFVNYHENFFYYGYGYGENGASRCNIKVNKKNQTISVEVRDIKNNANVSDLIFHYLLLFTFNNNTISF